MLVTSTTEANAQNGYQDYMTEDLGNPNWEEINPGLFIDTDIVQQDENTVVFDTFTEFDIVYIRFEGDCNAMTVKELRRGSFSEATIAVFGDVSDDPSRQYHAEEGNQYHALLNTACNLRSL
ncbi:MAG: hypothetical protein AAFS04_10440 [Cyanobacteria bacterium J06631_9]